MNAPQVRLVLFRVVLVIVVLLVFHLATTEVQYPAVSSVNDKVGHVLAFGLLSLLADFSFPVGRFGLAKILPLLGYGVLIEVVQYFLPYREASFFDVLADGVGVALYAMGIPMLDRIPVVRRLASLRRPL